VALYFDSSALVKLVLLETEHLPLEEWIAANPNEMATSSLALTEVERATRKNTSDRLLPEALRHLIEMFDLLNLIPLTDRLLRTAGSLTPTTLRSLDAIHLASALSLRPGLDGLVTYDNRMASAAQQLGITVYQPAGP